MKSSRRRPGRTEGNLPETGAGSGIFAALFHVAGREAESDRSAAAMDDAIMSDGALTKLVKEQIAVVVSSINSSSYCVKFHMELLRRFGIDRAMERKLTTDYENGPFEPKVKALFPLRRETDQEARRHSGRRHRRGEGRGLE